MEFQVYLTNAQLKKMAAGQNFQLTHEQLLNDGKNTVLVMNTKPVYKRLMKAIQSGKGFRFSPRDYHVDMEGGAVLSDIKRGFNNLGKNIRKGVSGEWKQLKSGAKKQFNEIGDDLKDVAKQKYGEYKGAATDYINLQLDKGKSLAKSKGKEAMALGERYANQYADKLGQFAEQKANEYADKGMQYLDNKLSAGDKYINKKTGYKPQKPPKPSGAKPSKPVVEETVYDYEDNYNPMLSYDGGDYGGDEGAVSAQIAGEGLRRKKGGRFPKGSAEAKAHMAKLRSMRGGNIWSDLGNAAKKVAYKVGDKVKAQGEKIAYKVGDDLKGRATNFANNELKQVLRQGSKYALDAGVIGVKGLANYVAPTSGEWLDPALDRLQSKAKQQIDKQIDKIKVGGNINPITGTVINPMSNDSLHYQVQWKPQTVKRKKIYQVGAGFIQV